MSLSIGKHIYKLLTESEKLNRMVGNRIFADSTKTETVFPFVLYKRNSLTPAYTKDRYGIGDAVTVEIVVASDKYLISVDIIEEVRKALERKRGVYDNFKVVDAKLIGANEDFIEDTFIQSLTFSIDTVTI